MSPLKSTETVDHPRPSGHEGIALSDLKWNQINEHEILCSTEDEAGYPVRLEVLTPELTVPFGLERGPSGSAELRLLLSSDPQFRSWLLGLERRIKRLPRFFPEFFLNNFNQSTETEMGVGLTFRSNLRNHPLYGDDNLLLTVMSPCGVPSIIKRFSALERGARVRLVLSMSPVWNYQSHFGYIWRVKEVVES